MVHTDDVHVDVEKGLRTTNYVDFNDDRRALVSCCNFNLNKTGFVDTNDATDVCFCVPSGACGFMTPLVNLFLTPFLLAWHFFWIYMVPAVSIVFSRIIMRFFCTINCCKTYYYDLDFPPNDRSIGHLDKKHQPAEKPHTISNLDCWWTGIWHMMLITCCRCFKPDAEYEWVRAVDLSAEGKVSGDDGAMKLFEGGVEANDICQGKLGDCWLMATMAAIADQPGLVESLFLSRERSLCGYYKIKLYDIYNGGTPKWRILSLDDKIPVQRGTKTPIFAQPSGRELWVLLLEKAFAKLMGSYARMDGGHPIEAMRVFTGCTPVRYTKSTPKIEGNYIAQKYKDTTAAPEVDATQLWNIMDAGVNHSMIICAARTTRGNQQREAKTGQGLHVGHAYTVLDTHILKTQRKVGEYGVGTRLIQLRNPWGGGEWTGPFGDNDKEFWSDKDGTNMTGRGKAVDKEDGCFWMPFDLFVKNFNMFDLCATKAGLSELELDINEDMGMCGPCYGCLEGFVDYCLLCKGTRRLWCPETRDTLQMINDFKDGQNFKDRMGARTAQI